MCKENPSDKKDTSAAQPSPSPEEKDGISERTKKIIGISALVIFVLFSAAMMYFVGVPLVRFLSEPEQFRQWVSEMGILGHIAFLGIMVLQVVIALIPGEVVEIGAGYAFGFWQGTFLCLLGATIGSALVFGLVRKFGSKLVEAFFPIEKIHSLKWIQNTRRLNTIVFIVFFIPGTPKDLLAYVVGLTPIKFRTWMAITFVARIPSVVTSTMGGNALGSRQYLSAIIVFAVTLLVSGAGILVYRRFFSKNKDADTANSEPDSNNS